MDHRVSLRPPAGPWLALRVAERPEDSRGGLGFGVGAVRTPVSLDRLDLVRLIRCAPCDAGRGAARGTFALCNFSMWTPEPESGSGKRSGDGLGGGDGSGIE